MQRSKKVLTTTLTVVLAGAVILGPETESRAGYRPLEVSFSNLTPDVASSEPSKKCVQTIRDRVVSDDANLKNWMETPLRKAIHAEKQTEAGRVPFTSWTVDQVAPAMEQQDAFLAVDCRPEEKVIELFLVNSDRAKIVFRLRGEELSRARLIWFGDEVMRHAWAGFVP
jgi:hypothetical protein